MTTTPAAGEQVVLVPTTHPWVALPFVKQKFERINQPENALFGTKFSWCGDFNYRFGDGKPVGKECWIPGYAEECSDEIGVCTPRLTLGLVNFAGENDELQPPLTDLVYYGGHNWIFAHGTKTLAPLGSTWVFDQGSGLYAKMENPDDPTKRCLVIEWDHMYPILQWFYSLIGQDITINGYISFQLRIFDELHDDPSPLGSNLRYAGKAVVQILTDTIDIIWHDPMAIGYRSIESEIISAVWPPRPPFVQPLIPFLPAWPITEVGKYSDRDRNELMYAGRHFKTPENATLFPSFILEPAHLEIELITPDPIFRSKEITTIDGATIERLVFLEISDNGQVSFLGGNVSQTLGSSTAPFLRCYHRHTDGPNTVFPFLTPEIEGFSWSFYPPDFFSQTPTFLTGMTGQISHGFYNEAVSMKFGLGNIGYSIGFFQQLSIHNDYLLCFAVCWQGIEAEQQYPDFTVVYCMYLTYESYEQPELFYLRSFVLTGKSATDHLEVSEIKVRHLTEERLTTRDDRQTYEELVGHSLEITIVGTFSGEITSDISQLDLVNFFPIDAQPLANKEVNMSTLQNHTAGFVLKMNQRLPTWYDIYTAPRYPWILDDPIVLRSDTSLPFLGQLNGIEMRGGVQISSVSTVGGNGVQGGSIAVSGYFSGKLTVDGFEDLHLETAEIYSGQFQPFLMSVTDFSKPKWLIGGELDTPPISPNGSEAVSLPRCPIVVLARTRSNLGLLYSDFALSLQYPEPQGELVIFGETIDKHSNFYYVFFDAQTGLRRTITVENENQLRDYIHANGDILQTKLAVDDTFQSMHVNSQFQASVIEKSGDSWILKEFTVNPLKTHAPFIGTISEGIDQENIQGMFANNLKLFAQAARITEGPNSGLSSGWVTERADFMPGLLMYKKANGKLQHAATPPGPTAQALSLNGGFFSSY